MGSVFKFRRRVEFPETDAAGFMHFSEYFRYMEATEHALLRLLGRSVFQRGEEGIVSFVRVHAECDFIRPLRFEEEVDVHLAVREVNEKSIVYDFKFHKLESAADVARGSITVVCILKRPDQDAVKAIEIPADLAAVLKERLR